MDSRRNPQFSCFLRCSPLFRRHFSAWRCPGCDRLAARCPGALRPQTSAQYPEDNNKYKVHQNCHSSTISQSSVRFKIYHIHIHIQCYSVNISSTTMTFDPNAAALPPQGPEATPLRPSPSVSRKKSPVFDINLGISNYSTKKKNQKKT